MALNVNRVFDLSKTNTQSMGKKSDTSTMKLFPHTDSFSQARLQLLKQQDRLENAIRTYEGDDPLDPYYTYVTWLEQNSSKLGNTNNLIPLLEEIIVNYKEWERYKQDNRFIHLAVKYINTQTNSLELYQLVFNQGLGTKCSMLYLAWAEKLEKMQDFKKADRVYFLGIDGGAQPIKVLEDAHIQFQLRIARKMLEENISDSFSTNEISKNALFKFPSSKHKNNFIGGITTGAVSSNSLKNYSKYSNVHKFRIYEEEENSQRIDETKVIGTCHNPKRKQFRETVSNQIVGSFVNKDIKKFNETAKTVKSGFLKTKKEEFKCPVAIFEPDDISKKPMYLKHLVYAEGCDIQLEEIRAMCYPQKMKKLYLCDTGKESAGTRTENFIGTSNEPVNLTKSFNTSFEQKQNSVVLGDKFKTECEDTMSRKSASFSYDPLLRTQFIEPVLRTNSNEELKRNKVYDAPLPSMTVTENKEQEIGNSMKVYDAPCPSMTVTENEEQEIGNSMSAGLSSKCNYNDNFVNSRNIESNDCSTFPKLVLPFTVQEKFEKTNKLPEEDNSIDFRSSHHNTSTFHQSPSTSFTVNTRAAWNVIQKMWESPLASQHSVTKEDATKENLGNFLFKIPHSRTPRRKISFPAFLDDELNFERNKCAIRNSEDNQVSNFPEKSAFTSDFRAFTDTGIDLEKPDNKNVLDHWINSKNVQRTNGIPSVNWEKHWYSNDEKSDNQFGIPHVPNDVDLAGRMNALKMNGNKEKQEMPLPLIVHAKVKNVPVDESEDKENQAPKDYFTPSERRPVCGILTPAIDIPVKEIESEDSDMEDIDDVDYLVLEKNRQVDEDTCNTKTFDFFIPSSTPFSRNESPRQSRKSSVYNGSYISEDYAAVKNPFPSVSKPVSDHLKKCNEGSTANLSLILENSKEQGSNSSSSGANVGTRNFFF